jgi:uncharacterized membrane protein YhfC
MIQASTDAKCAGLEMNVLGDRRMTMNRTLEEMDSIDPGETKNVLQQHRALWDFFGNLMEFFVEHNDRFLDIEALEKKNLTQWDEGVQFDAIGYKQITEKHCRYYVSKDFFERLIKPLPLQSCVGFLMGLNSLFEEDGKLLFKKPFKGKEEDFYAVKGPKMEAYND